MKKSLILLIILSISVFTACSRQEKMNAQIFIERFTELSDSSFVTEEEFNYNSKYYFFFKDSAGSDYIIELTSDEFGNIRKICLAANKTDKTDLIKHYCGLIINAYAPGEDAKTILSYLFKNSFDYSDTQWFRYSSAVSDEGVFFSVENLRYSTESDAQLTLKQNDIISP